MTLFQSQLQEWATANEITLVYAPTLVSTNLTAREAKWRAGTLVTTEYQTHGRGQQGNVWESRPGENLMFSVILEPGFLSAGQQFFLSKIATLALADTLAGLGLDARIKWPNDVYIGNGKIAGILIENDLTGTAIRRSIAGIGLNVNQVRFPEVLPNPTSIALEKGEAYDRAALLITLYDNLGAWYARLAAGEHEEIDRRYLEKIYLLGEETVFIDGNKTPFSATIVGVLPTGELQLRHSDDHTVRHYLFKEIEYRIVPDPD